MALWFPWLGSKNRAARRKTHRTRQVRFEALERRELLATIEGGTFSLSQAFDKSGLAGDFSASIDWGDATPTTAGTVSLQGVIKARIDYSLDTSNFFDFDHKKQLLQLAADLVLSRLGDQLSAIVPMPSAGKEWSMVLVHPATGGDGYMIQNPTVAANEVVIYVGARNFDGKGLALGGAGGYACTEIFCSEVQSRGQAGAATMPPTDFSPWGGSLAFDSEANWYFGESTAQLGQDQADFLSVAIHEITHLLGFGGAPTWNGFVSSGFFTGPASTQANGGASVPLAVTGANDDPDNSHWKDGTTSGGQPTAMSPRLTNGTRTLLTPLDLAGLADVGWEIVDPQLTVTGDHIFADDGAYNIKVVVTDSSGGSVSSIVIETVTNADPQVQARRDRLVFVGQSVPYSDIGKFTDQGFGPAESFTYSIDWGDGSSTITGAVTIDQPGAPGVLTEGSFNATHAYLSAGDYTVSVTVEDDDGGTSGDTFQVSVVEVSWHNSVNGLDVNGDLSVSPIDALLVIDDINEHQSRKLPTPVLDHVPNFLVEPSFFDVNNDGDISPVDAVQVINFLNEQSAMSEGEGRATPLANAGMLPQSTWRAAAAFQPRLEPVTPLAPTAAQTSLPPHALLLSESAQPSRLRASLGVLSPSRAGESRLGFDALPMSDLEQAIDALVRK